MVHCAEKSQLKLLGVTQTGISKTHTHTHTHTHKQLKLLGVTETDLSPATSPKKENKYSATKDVAEGDDSKAADAGSDAHGSAGIECVLC